MIGHVDIVEDLETGELVEVDTSDLDVRAEYAREALRLRASREHLFRRLKLDHATGSWSPDPDKEAYYEVKTWWRTLDDFVAWTRSDAFAEAHANRPPKEMFRGPSQLDVHEVFLSTDP